MTEMGNAWLVQPLDQPGETGPTPRHHDPPLAGTVFRAEE
nr:hypothetical protein [Kibdelosporangium sp. MJ126-NF4]CTQ97429.1 hypothetical protein [Kibdelosporangium sp. MJ126-NF4]